MVQNHNHTDYSATNTPGFPVWTFHIPEDVANLGVQVAIYGQDPTSLDWKYWVPSKSCYKTFSGTGQNLDCVIDATPQQGKYTTAATFLVTLPTGQCLQSGVVAMFIGGCSGISVTSGVPASPTTSTNPNDRYSLFEFTYAVGAGQSEASLDIDISNVDQVGFTYTVTSTSAPFPLSKVGSPIPLAPLFKLFEDTFPAGHAFRECLALETGPGGAPLRLLAPQDVLQAVTVPITIDYLCPTTPSSQPNTSFADNTYFYMASETSPTGETAPSQGVFGGFLRDANGTVTATEINVGWQASGTPIAYAPTNPQATGINIYRAEGPQTNSTEPVPLPTTAYTLLTGMSISDWNAQTNYVFPDEQTSTSAQTPQATSYGFSALSTWFDKPLVDFFNYYGSNVFSLYQSNQTTGSNGTLWTGQVFQVSPKQGDAITQLTYIDENGNQKSITTTWQWGDGTQAYTVLQLVGNAYDPTDISNTNLSGVKSLTTGEYQGAVLNIYFPYFSGNAEPSGTEQLPDAPAWMNNTAYGPSQMVFGCAGVFATPNDPDALAQASYADLAVNALTNLQNVIVSALNRGIATSHDVALTPQQYTCLFSLSQPPSSAPAKAAVPPGTYTYYLSGTLNNGDETVLSWGQTITLPAATKPTDFTVTLEWLPQPTWLYKQVNIYRQKDAGPIVLVGSVTNTTTSLSFTDENKNPTSASPFVFYPGWKNAPSTKGYVPSNLFSAFLHQNYSQDPTSGISINGLVYGYPFDDQGGFSTNINYGSQLPSGVTFQISPITPPTA